MAWFSNKKEGQNSFAQDDIPQLDDLPALPQLPQLPPLNNEKSRYLERPQPLPSLPSSKMGNKFAQSAIKDAVSDKKFQKEFEESENFNYPEKPQFKRLTQEMEEDEIPYEFKEAAKKVKRVEPIFVRLDKFEDSLATFESMRQKVEEMKDILKDIKDKKSKEEQELVRWESELQSMKSQIEKIDKEIFSTLD